MNAEEFESLLRAEVEEAKSHFERAKRALEAYLGENKVEDMRRTKYPDQKPSSIAVEVRKIVDSLDPRYPFSTEDVFAAMNNENRVFSKTRPSISIALARMVDEGKLEKPTRRSFRKTLQAQTIPNGDGLW